MGRKIRLRLSDFESRLNTIDCSKAIDLIENPVELLPNSPSTLLLDLQPSNICLILN